MNKAKIFAYYWIAFVALSQLTVLAFPDFSPIPFSVKNKSRYYSRVVITDLNGIQKERRIAYLDSLGGKETVILIHGSPGSANQLRELYDQLREKYRVIAPDLPGFGLSDAYLSDYGAQSGAQTISGLMKNLGIKTAHVVGYSFGGAVALNMVRLNPDAVESVVLYGGIGVQEGEGSGDYYFEHFKYYAGFIPITVVPELLPHFGILGSFSHRLAFIRSFIDTDQRPLAGVIESMDTPLLIVHGINEFLVPPWTAREHHRLAENSVLRMNRHGHFLPFSDDGVKFLFGEISSFIDSVSDLTFPRDLPNTDMADTHRSLPVPFDLDFRAKPWKAIISIVTATFVSEDLTIVSAGILAGDGRLDLFLAIFACFLGIFVGDAGLWLLGRFSAGPLSFFPFTRRIIDGKKMRAISEAYVTHGGKIIFLSRFIPGTRFITYTGAGFLRLSARKYLFWAFLAGVVWTPLLVILSAIFGPVMAKPFLSIFGEGFLASIATILTLFYMVKFLVLALTEEGRIKLISRIVRLKHFEYWPSWFVYIPLIIYSLILAIRYRSWMVFTLANPSIPFGGIVGESKYEILKKLDHPASIPTALLDEPDPGERWNSFQSILEKNNWSFPVIIKPDRSQRGQGFKKIGDENEARTKLSEYNEPILIQQFHPGPFEAGILYYRFPGENHGKIFSITDKEFPRLIADGKSTLKKLILQHPRYRIQSSIFFERCSSELNHIHPKGTILKLGIAGNHCQGTMFRDGSDLITPELESEIDRISQKMPGFYIGRYDVRYYSREDFMRGKNFSIIELNGATGESTNIYDPGFGFLDAYRILFHQLRLLFAIGNENRKRGLKPEPFIDLVKEIYKFYHNRSTSNRSD